MKYGSLDIRMKKYEYVTRTYLVRRTPVIIRLDGKAFHTFTRGFKKPFDEVLVNAMQKTMKYLCENIQGCVLGYTQSDEITLVLVDYKKLDSAAWFDYNIQKCVSVAASMATLAFNRAFQDEIIRCDNEWSCSLTPQSVEIQEAQKKYIENLEKAAQRGAMFDARVFNIPKEEVCNCVLWRQNDATRNSIEMVGQAHFSQSQLHKKTCNQIQDMLMLEKGINWNNVPTHLKRGSCCVRKVDNETGRSKWIIDTEIPIFKGEGRKYIDNLICIGE